MIIIFLIFGFLFVGAITTIVAMFFENGKFIGVGSILIGISLIITFSLIPIKYISKGHEITTLVSSKSYIIDEKNEDEILDELKEIDSLKIRINNETESELIVLTYEKEKYFANDTIGKLFGEAFQDKKTETKYYLYINKLELNQ